MTRVVLEVLNGFFFVFHTLLIVFNVIGWAWKRTRIFNLICLTGTALSWLFLGVWYGTGYCICTDLHFRVRAALGIHDHADNYLQLMARTLFGLDLSPAFVRDMAAWVFGVCFVTSLALNARDRMVRSALFPKRA